MDIKHNFSVNPLLPAYRNDLLSPHTRETALNWVESEAGQVAIGHAGTDFAYDNETPRHERLLHRHRLADRLVTNAEYLEFIEEGGYQNPALWLADGLALVQKTGWQHPLYWHRQEKDWMQYSLGGLRALELYEPVCHVSYYEADAYARWAGKRLPLEEELEYRLEQEPLQGNFVEDELLHPQAVKGPSQWYGDLWNWTASPYMPYPGFKPMAGSIGEYNGKFMSNQMVLKGGCCVTSRDHVRASYRNFFYPDERWAFTGIRLAEDVE